MSNYATTEELKCRIGADNFSALYLDLRDATTDIVAAEAEVDGVLSRRYLTPIPKNSACFCLLKNWVLALSEELAWGRGGSPDLPTKLVKRVETARSQIERAAGGGIRLAGAVESPDAISNIAVVEMDKPVFTRKKLRGY